MKGMDLSRFAAVPVVMAAILTAMAGAQQPMGKAGQDEVAPPREIVVSLEDRKLALIENGEVRRIYTVAVGKPSTPSPEGTFTIQRRVANPTYQHEGKTVPAGPNNPVGTRWMGLSKPGYGIHGTNEPKSIGRAASHGCIRMAKGDLEELYPRVVVGDTVRLIGHRDEETARLFGPASGHVSAGVLNAKADVVPAATSANETAPAAANAVAAMGTR